MTTTSTLLLRLEGPAQAWGGASSRWDYRTTTDRPTKSGVIGLVANALGRDYADPVDDLAALKFAARADRPGHTEYDFRIAGGGTFPLDARTAWNNPQLVADDSGNINYGAPRLSKNNAWTEAAREGVRRPVTFLADAAFLVSLTGHTPLLEQVAADLERPARLLCLGRRAHPPAHPLLHTLLDGNQHDSWPHQVPLLPVATTTTPQAWVETSPGEGTGVVAYEQPPSPPRRGGGHGPLLLSHITTQPPAATLEAS